MAPTIRSRTLVALVALAGCGHIGAARQAYEHGNYLQAERLADQQLRDHPDDGEAQTLRQQAREKGLAALLEESRTARARGDREGALAALGRLLERRRIWNARLPGDGEAALAQEVALAGEAVRGEVAPLLARGRALAAEAQLERRRALLDEPELAAQASALRFEVHETGGRTCAALTQAARPEEPYWTRLAGRYCAHFGAPAPAVRLPGFGGLGFAGAIEGLAGGEHVELQQRLNAAFMRTPWYAPEGPSAGSRLEGHHKVTFTTREATRTHHYSERVPYQDTEYYYESHQVPYTASETYYVSVPYTTNESYTYTCGYGTNYRTCTGYRPVTHYRQESRSRMVTKYRSESQQKWRPVTKYRMESRSRVYTVTEHVGAYATNLSIAVNLGTGAPAVARAEASKEQVQESSDSLFAVLEKTEGLPTVAQWFAPRVSALEGALTWELRRAWFASACGGTTPSREQAARCLHGTKDLPAAARSALESELAEDAPRAIELAK